MNISYRQKGFLKSLILIFLSGILAITLSNCKNEFSYPLRIGSNIWPGYATLYLARDLGDYDNTTIKLVDYPSTTEAIRAYRHEEIEGAAVTMDEALVLASTQDNIRIIAIFNISDGGDVILGKPEIKTMKDLKGKRVGVESTALGAFFLTRALEESGMSIEDINIVSLELSEHEKAYQNDKTSLRVGLVKNKGIITSAYLCLVTNEKIKPEFAYYLLHAYDLLKVYYGMGSGLRQNLSFTDF